MELREYGRIVARRWGVVVGLVAIVLLASLIWPSPTLSWLLGRGPVGYQATARFTVGIVPEPRIGEYYAYDHYYTWLASEYLVDDLAEVVGGAAFAQAVERVLAAQGTPASRPLAGAFAAATKHRTLILRLGWHDGSELERIAAAARQVLTTQSATFFGQLGAGEADIRLIDSPAIVPASPGLRTQLDLPLRLLLALVAGAALAFLWHYLEDAVQDRAEVEALGLPVIGELPADPRQRHFPWQRPLP